ncbi:MAG: hypothetical protein IPJ58_12455 [Ardenticatenia bacterium]|nr:hypothetical protein [Ardenticatenia bacterium]
MPPPTRPTLPLTLAGIQAEFERRVDDARQLYAQAWDAAGDDYERCVAAHYVGHLEADPAAALRWHLAALDHAQLADAQLVADFLPSLYVNLGQAYEVIGDAVLAERYYRLAAELGLLHQPR